MVVIYARLYLGKEVWVLSVPLDYPMDLEFFNAGKDRVEKWLTSIGLFGHTEVTLERSRIKTDGNEKTVTGTNALTFTFDSIALKTFLAIQLHKMITVFYQESKEQTVAVNITGIAL